MTVQEKVDFETPAPAKTAVVTSPDVGRGLPTSPDVGRGLPFSGLAVRASDVVTVEILERAINDDVRQFSTSCSGSLCVLAAMIVSRVLDSACSRVMREDRLPPATTWTEKARREAVLLVEDVLASAMIYVSRGSSVYAGVSHSGPTTAQRRKSSKLVHYATDEVTKEPYTTKQHQPPAQLPWPEDYDEEFYDTRDNEEDRVEPLTHEKPAKRQPELHATTDENVDGVRSVTFMVHTDFSFA